jgi:monosaccharide-transporting ATPase
VLPTTPTESPALSVKALSKTFPGVKALDRVDFELRRGEVHALMGENGAGKSTLIKVLTGIYSPDGGRIELEGRPIHARSPLESQQLGISTVYQEVNLIPYLSVAENITLGRQPSLFGFVRWPAIRKHAHEALRRLGLEIDVGRPLASYSIAIQQLVAIARAVDISAKVLVLDEPTSSLDALEVEQLFEIIRKLKSEGLGIIFVTHFLDQVYAVSDRITILRNGQLVGAYQTAQLPRLELIARMIGKDPNEIAELSAHREACAPGEQRELIQASQLGRMGAIEPFDLNINTGEVVGLAGLLGSGRTETARLLFGIDPPTSGTLTVDGKRLNKLTTRRAVALQFAFCSEDRKTEGIVPNLSIRENIALALQARRGSFKPLRREEQNTIANRYIQSLRIATTDAEKPIKLLSGGNQQKALLGRWLASEPRFIILDEPTRGIDVGAKFEILSLVRKLVERGLAILFISSELEEVVRTSTRVVVLRDRKKVGELRGNEISETAIMKSIAAHTEETARS